MKKTCQTCIDFDEDTGSDGKGDCQNDFKFKHYLNDMYDIPLDGMG